MAFEKLYFIPILTIYISIQLSLLLTPLSCLDEIPKSDVFLFIADPQIEGRHKMNKGWIDTLDLYLNDYSMSVVYKLAFYQYVPDYIVILGDLFSLQHTIDEEFYWRLERYKNMFPIYSEHFYNLSGNHDIGYGMDMREWMVKRFERSFGKTNFVINTTEYELIFINSMALDGTFESSIHDKTWRFIQDIPAKSKTRLVFLHIPLYPKNVTYCESNLYRDSNGLFHFQNYLTRNTSIKLLQLLNPDFVVSGHNHDGCFTQINYQPEYRVEELLHRDHQGIIGEFVYGLTVRSIMGIYDGGFALLSMNSNNFHYKECTTVNFLTVRIFLVTDLILIIIGTVLLIIKLINKYFKQYIIFTFSNKEQHVPPG